MIYSAQDGFQPQIIASAWRSYRQTTAERKHQRVFIANVLLLQQRSKFRCSAGANK